MKKHKTKSWANDVKAIFPISPGGYGFELSRESTTLACLHGCRELFQAILSQAGSHLLNGKFHDDWRVSIGKAEGGFWIPSHGEFVMTPGCVWMDTYNSRVLPNGAERASQKLTELVTHIVLEWNPERHEDSMYEVAAAHSGTTAPDLRKAVESVPSYRTTIECLSRDFQFTNPISYFFGWNESDEIPYDTEFRDYWLKSSSTIPIMIEQTQENYRRAD